MKNLSICSLFVLIFTNFHAPTPKPAWGFFGHKRINRLAVFTLPEAMLPLFKTHVDYLTEQSVVPDKRRYIIPAEGFRHYINLDKWKFLPTDKIEAQILNTSIFIVGEKHDTSVLTNSSTIRKAKRDYFLKARSIKKIFGRDSIVVADSAMRRFFIHSLKQLDPYENLSISVDSLTQLFKKEGLILRGVKSAFAKDELTQHGILPYHLIEMQRQLTAAFVAKNQTRILKIAAELGHYIGDAHVPLHTISNYDGQFTQQNGIHGFWEVRLPELFADNQYDFYVGRAPYFDNARLHYWDIIKQSNQLVAKVLQIEKEIATSFPNDKKYCPETVNGFVIQKPCFDFAQAYHTRLNGMVENQMRQAILAVGAAWYTAWVEAGQPDLSNLKSDPLSTDEQKQQEKADKALENRQKMLGRHEEH
jgi:hypothetical protein